MEGTDGIDSARNPVVSSQRLHQISDPTLYRSCSGIKSGGIERYGGSRRTCCASRQQDHPNLRGSGNAAVFSEKLSTCDEILNPLESLLGSNIEFVLNRHNHIYLRDAGSTHSLELHRDVRHWSRTIATVLIYLEETNLENGCTRVVPGSHHLHCLCAFQR